MIGIPIKVALTHIVHSAIRADNAKGGALFTLEQPGNVLRMAAHVGLSDAAAARAQVVTDSDNTASGQAVRERHRVVIRDVAGDEYGENTAEALKYGVHAIQATPLIDEQRRVVGVLSTFYGEPHHPTADALRKFDLCAAIAVRLLELDGAFDTALRSNHRSAEAVRVLLPACAEQIVCDEAALVALQRYLDQLAEELAQER